MPDKTGFSKRPIKTPQMATKVVSKGVNYACQMALKGSKLIDAFCGILMADSPRRATCLVTQGDGV